MSQLAYRLLLVLLVLYSIYSAEFVRERLRLNFAFTESKHTS